MIKYYIRTTGERTIDKSFSQITYDYLIDKEHKKGEIFASQLLSVKDTDVVLLEDDIILCNNFKERIEEVINKHRKDIINFFTLPTLWFESKYRTSFCYNQCTYIPQYLIEPLSEAIQEGWNVLMPESDHQLSVEPLMKYAIKKLNLQVYNPRPCLVQHIDDGSLLKHYRLGRRRSIYFIDYLEQLGVSYEEAKIRENKHRLQELMDNQFAEIDKKMDYSLLQQQKELEKTNKSIGNIIKS